MLPQNIELRIVGVLCIKGLRIGSPFIFIII